jgi:hypothetical protein
LIFFSEKSLVVANMKSHQRKWKMKKKSRPTYTKNSNFHIKSGNDREIFQDSLKVRNLIQSGWFFFLQFIRSLKLRNRAELPWKSNFRFLVRHINLYIIRQLGLKLLGIIFIYLLRASVEFCRLNLKILFKLHFLTR